MFKFKELKGNNSYSVSRIANMDLKLVCCESSTIENRAYPDKVLLSNRVLDNLLKSEEQYALSASFLRKQTEVTPHMRKIVAEWMMEVSFRRFNRFLNFSPKSKKILFLHNFPSSLHRH